MLEAQGRWEEAILDYRTVLKAVPEDPSAWNNLGNASAGLGRCAWPPTSLLRHHSSLHLGWLSLLSRQSLHPTCCTGPSGRQGACQQTSSQGQLTHQPPASFTLVPEPESPWGPTWPGACVIGFGVPSSALCLQVGRCCPVLREGRGAGARVLLCSSQPRPGAVPAGRAGHLPV